MHSFFLRGACGCMIMLALSAHARAQVFLKLVDPTATSIKTGRAKQFIIGSTCKDCRITMNDTNVYVYPTGAFAYELKLSPGDTSIVVQAKDKSGKTVIRTIKYSYTIPPPPTAVKEFAIAGIQTFPAGNLVLQPGDRIRFRVQAQPGNLMTTYNNTPLYELPVTQTKGLEGIYQGEYIVKPTDTFTTMKFPVRLMNAQREVVNASTVNSFAVMSPLSSDIAITQGRLAYLEFGLGEDRLGGAKIGYLDSLVPLQITGKVGNDYRVKLAPNRTAYIPDDLVTLQPKGNFAPSSLTGNITVSGDEKNDYVKLSLESRLPYESMQEPNLLIVDVFGATSNTNWITQLNTSSEVQSVDYQQVSDDVFRLKIRLRHAQHWGHALYYTGNTLVIRIRHQPANLSLRGMIIGVDAGHGGSNTGGGGPTGSSEKALALAVSLKLQRLLQQEGAQVIMSRTSEKFFDNKQRILFYRDSMPDLLVSVHLNSSSDPIHAEGTSTHYNHIGFKPLTAAIHKRMLALGLKDYGDIGAFNFMLNSPTEYPNALVETLFLSNPAEEMLIMDDSFQQRIAEAIVAGLKDFLHDVK